MPAEPTKAKLKRRTSRKDLDEYRFDGVHARELELKRSRGEVSCAECRRLKIKCDKQIPCQSCQRRGCAALCPNGSLATGQGTRFVLAATEHLHRRISRLSGRIRQLEDALAALQAQHSSEPHPLLHEDLIAQDEKEEGGMGMLDGGAIMEDGAGAGGVGVGGPAGEVIDAFGTLSISDHGISRFFGPTGGSESLLLANLDSSHASPSSSTPDSMRDSRSPHSAPLSAPAASDLSLFSQSFPFTPMGATADVQDLISSHLPPWERATALCETYFEQVSWVFRGVTRIQLMDDMLPVIYRHAPSPPGEDYSSPHDLALLFTVFAIGELVSREPSNAQGEHFHQIARAAVALQPVLEKPSIVTIQALHLMSIYNAMSGSDLRSETSMEMTWSLVTLASHLSQTIGLHRDSERWGLSPKMVQRRRILFWDLFVADVWQSLNTGRPPSFSLAYIDCSFPQYGNTGEKGKEGGFGSAFEIWQFKFAAECVADVTSRTLTAEAPSYATIMELDRKVREFPLPEGISNARTDDMAASFQRCVLDHIRETVLMYIHRSFFAQAIIEHPTNPLKSAYAPSFLAAYRASSTILKSVREQFNIWPNSCSRFWTMWTFAFTAAVVFGTVVTRGPRSPLAQQAMAELEQACILFTKASVYSIRATKALPILTKLSEKARYALAAAQSDPNPGENGGVLWNIKQEDTDDELSIFAGHTRFVSAKRSGASTDSSVNTSPPHSVRFESSPTSYPAAPPPPPPAHDAQEIHRMPQLHPISTSYTERHAGPSSASATMVSSSQGWPSAEHTRDEYMAPLSVSDERTSHMHYSYVPSERAMQQPEAITSSSSSGYGWGSESQHLQHEHQLHNPQQHRQQHHQHQQHQQPQQYVVPSQAPPIEMQRSHAQYGSHYHPQQTHLQHHMLHQDHDQQQQMYGGYQSHGAPPHSDLVDLGLASRDSRLDERWSSFMADSGLLDDIGFRGGR